MPRGDVFAVPREGQGPAPPNVWWVKPLSLGVRIGARPDERKAARPLGGNKGLIETRAVVERLGGDVSLLRVGPGQAPVEWPTSCLPAELREGDLLRFSVAFDPVNTEQLRRKVAGLVTRLSTAPREPR